MTNANRTWWKECVVYQIYPRSFYDSNGDGIGDLKGITKKICYLKDLGVDVIWLSPIYASPCDDNGYDISDYYSILNDFGTMNDFDELLKTAHENNIKVLMDLVVNHTSDEHKWFKESRKSIDNPYRDYYIWRSGNKEKEPNNWGSCFAGSAWEYDKTTDMYYLHLFSKKQPDLNWSNPKVREEIMNMMDWWLKKGIDGFRMDAITLISKDDTLPDGIAELSDFASFEEAAHGPNVHEYLQEMRNKVLNKYNVMTVGEGSAVTLEEAKKYASSNGNELDMVFHFEHMGVDYEPKGNSKNTKINLPKFKATMSKWQKGLENISWNSLYLENHDQPRSISRFTDFGEYREEAAKMLATCLHMMQGTPYIYQGEELGMTNVPFSSIDDIKDIDSLNHYKELKRQNIYSEKEILDNIKLHSRDNARTPFQWSDDINGGFTSGTPWIMLNPNYNEINAAEQLNRPNSIFNYYKNLIRLRKENKIIVYGSYDLLYPDSEDIYAYTRTLKDEKLLIICNFSNTNQEIDIPEEFLCGDYLISNYPLVNIMEKMILHPFESFVIKK